MSSCLSVSRRYDLSLDPRSIYAIIDHEYPRASISNARFREYATNLNDDSSRLTFSVSRNEVHMGCKHSLLGSCVMSD